MVEEPLCVYEHPLKTAPLQRSSGDTQTLNAQMQNFRQCLITREVSHLAMAASGHASVCSLAQFLIATRSYLFPKFKPVQSKQRVTIHTSRRHRQALRRVGLLRKRLATANIREVHRASSPHTKHLHS